jgi:F0F1-type ATP synthase assembly protein I
VAVRRPRSPATAWGRAFEVAFEAGLAVILGVLIGNWIDQKLETSPLFLFVFLALGFATGLRRLLSIQSPKGSNRENEAPGSDRESQD